MSKENEQYTASVPAITTAVFLEKLGEGYQIVNEVFYNGKPFKRNKLDLTKDELIGLGKMIDKELK